MYFYLRGTESFMYESDSHMTGIYNCQDKFKYSKGKVTVDFFQSTDDPKTEHHKANTHTSFNIIMIISHTLIRKIGYMSHSVLAQIVPIRYELDLFAPSTSCRSRYKWNSRKGPSENIEK